MRVYTLFEQGDCVRGDPTASPMLPMGGTSEVPGANMAIFWESRGRRVFEMNGVLWVHHKGPFFSPLPLHLCLDAEPDEINAILRKASIKGIRFPSSKLPGLPGGTYVIRPAGYGLRSIDSKHRGRVKHGLDTCEIRHLDPDELLLLGMELNRDTLSRQGRNDPDFLDPVKWKQLVEAVRHCPGMSIHGAFVDKRLATYVISCREGEWLHILYKMSRTVDREHHSDHALDYSIIQEASRSGINLIGNGCVSTLPHEGLDRYKRQLGYQVVEHSLCIHFHPLLAPLLSSKASVSIARCACSLFPKRESLTYGTRILEGASMSRSKRIG